MRNRIPPIPTGTVTLALTAIMLAGCDSTPPLAVHEDSPGDFSNGALAAASHGEDPSWYVVGEGTATPRRTTIIQGSRYCLVIPAGAVLEPTTITIRERDPRVVDVELGPDGTRFAKQVQLRIDYRGTAYDPESPRYAGAPALYWFNPGTGDWQTQPGVNRPRTMTFVGFLEHFSRYALSGTAGWEGTAGWDGTAGWERGSGLPLPFPTMGSGRERR